MLRRFLIAQVHSGRHFVRRHAVLAVAGQSLSQQTWKDSGRRAWSQHTYSWLNAAPAVTAALLAAVGIQEADNCGIIGVVGGEDEAAKYLIEGLTIMRNRGYIVTCTNEFWII